MVINNTTVLKVLAMALSMSALSLMAADAAVASDKDEKETHAQHEQVDKKEIAAFIRDIPDQIPFVIPENQQIKKDGKPVKEFIESDYEEALTKCTVRELLETALNDKKQPIIARVITQGGRARELVAHYFDAEMLRKEFEIGGRGYRHPLNRELIQQLSYFVYIPEFKRFQYIDRLGISEQTLSLTDLQDLAKINVTRALNGNPQFHKKRRELLTFLSEKAAIHTSIKNIAHFNLAMCLYYGEGGLQDSARACELLELVTKTDGKKVALAHAYLALWYWQESRKNSLFMKKIRDHALHAIGNEAAMKSLLMSRQAEVYRIAGELLVRDTNHAHADKALSFFNKALDLAEKAAQLPAEQGKLSPGFIARVHAHLALCYYHAPLHGSPEYVPDQGRYERAWHYCTQALSHYEQVKDIDGFIDAAIDMYYFALGNDGDVKKALALCNKKYPDGYGYRLDHVFSHYDYYRASIKEPSKRKEAIESLQRYIESLQRYIDDAQEAEDTREVRYYMALALLGEMYLHESDRARDLAKLHITSDPDFARDCDRQADALDAKAKELFNRILTQMPREYRSSYAWALTHLLLAQKELKSPVKNYETVSTYLRVIYQEKKEFPLLASSACLLIDDIQRIVEFELDDDEEHIHNVNEQHIHAKDPRNYEKVFERAMSAYNTVKPDSDKLEQRFKTIHDLFKNVADNSTNALLKAQAKQALKITEKEFASIREMRKKDENTEEGRAFIRLVTPRLARSKSKSIRKYYQNWLKIEEAERAGLSLAMPEDVEPAAAPVAMDARPDADARRGTKRNAEDALVDPRARDEAGAASIAHIARRAQANGSGSGSA